MPNFHLPPHYDNLALEVNISFDVANLNMINISIYEFLDMATIGEASEWESATTLG